MKYLATYKVIIYSSYEMTKEEVEDRAWATIEVTHIKPTISNITEDMIDIEKQHLKERSSR